MDHGTKPPRISGAPTARLRPCALAFACLLALAAPFTFAACPYPTYAPSSNLISTGRCSGACLAINPDTIKKFENGITNGWKKNAIITSGCRTPAQQAALTRGSSGGSHTRGDAIDSVPAGGGCEPYKAAVEQANNETYLTCNHGTGPHLHVDLRNGPPPQDKKPEDYKRQDQPQGQPPGGGGAPGGGSPGGGQGSGSGERPPSYERPATESSITKAFEPEKKTAESNRPPKQDTPSPKAVDIDPLKAGKGVSGKEASPPSSITRGDFVAELGGKDKHGPSGSGGAREGFSSGGNPGSGNVGGAPPALGGAEKKKEEGADTAKDHGGSYSAGGGWKGGGGGGSSGGSSDDSLSPFAKNLSDPKFAINNGDVSPNALSEGFGVDAAGRDPASEGEGGAYDDGIGARDTVDLFTRARDAHVRCQQKGCVTTGGRR